MSKTVLTTIVGLALFAGASAGAVPNVQVPALAPPARLLVACLWPAPEAITRSTNLTEDRAEMAMLGSLAGLLLKHGAQTGLYLESNVDARLVLQDLSLRRNVTYTYAKPDTTAWDIAKQLAPEAGVREFTLFDGANNPQSTNAARMATTVYNAIMVDRSVASRAVSAGFSMAADVTLHDNLWSLTHWVPNWNGTKSIAVEQSNNITSTDFDRVNDIAAAFGAIAFGSVGSGSNPGPTRSSFLDAMPSQVTATECV